MYESRTYDNDHAEPVVVLVVTGAHDVSRLVNTLNGAQPVIEQIGLGMQIVRQLKRHNFGRGALSLLKAHGGRDFTDEQSPTDPAELRRWLCKLSFGTILRERRGGAWQVAEGVESGAGPDRLFPALLSASGDMFELAEDHPGLDELMESAPFTVLALGETAPDE